ncbi:MAG TPA: hypothetical protein VH230_06905, partial [Stellaceae bacterium]|nr:hypothetical protein [Stellaceae bacterium]
MGTGLRRCGRIFGGSTGPPSTNEAQSQPICDHYHCLRLTSEEERMATKPYIIALEEHYFDP